MTEQRDRTLQRWRPMQPIAGPFRHRLEQHAAEPIKQVRSARRRRRIMGDVMREMPQSGVEGVKWLPLRLLDEAIRQAKEARSGRNIEHDEMAMMRGRETVARLRGDDHE